MLITAGNTENEMFILHDGLLRSFYKGKYGKEFYKVFLSNFQVASAFIELEAGIPSEIYIEALERTEVFCIKHKDVKELYRRHMCWNLIGNKGIEYFPRLKETREYEFLMHDAQERLNSFNIDSPGLFIEYHNIRLHLI